MQAAPRTQSLVRAMDVLRAVAEHADETSPAQIAQRTGLPRPTVYRLLDTLETLGAVERTADGGWAFGHELVRLARAADPARGLIARARPVLEGLMASTGEAAMLMIGRGQFDIDVVDQVDAPNLLGMTQWVGRPVTRHASAAGRLMLAALEPDARSRLIDTMDLPQLTRKTITDRHAFAEELKRIARQGYAMTIDELEEGLTGIAAPAQITSTALPTMIGIYGPTSRLVEHGRSAYVDAVVSAARQLETELAT